MLMPLGEEIKDVPFKGRGLSNFYKYVGDFTANLNDPNECQVRILEIGCGFGQLLLELSESLNGPIELYGINNHCDILNFDKVLEVASIRGVLINKRNGEDRFKFINHDVELGLPFPDNYFDIIISQVCIPYINNKLFLIEEINRTLNQKGTAWLHVGFEQSQLCDKTPYKWETLELKKNGKRIPLASYFQSYQSINYQNRISGSTIKMRKANLLSFPCQLIESLDLGKLNQGFYGVKSIFEILA